MQMQKKVSIILFMHTHHISLICYETLFWFMDVAVFHKLLISDDNMSRQLIVIISTGILSIQVVYYANHAYIHMIMQPPAVD